MDRMQVRLIMTFMLFLLIALAPAPMAKAQNEPEGETYGPLTVWRTAPETTRVGEKVWILIQIENGGSDEVEFTFQERLGAADFDQEGAQFTEIYDPGPEGDLESKPEETSKLWYYEWAVRLPPSEKATLTYWIIPKRPGEYVLSPAILTIGEETHRTRSAVIQVQCLADQQCDMEGGENYLTCPEDCFTGAADGICDGASDRRIDPDCKEGSDPDSEALAPTQTPMPTPTPEVTSKRALPQWTLWAALVFIALIVIITIVVAILIFRRKR